MAIAKRVVQGEVLYYSQYSLILIRRGYHLTFMVVAIACEEPYCKKMCFCKITSYMVDYCPEMLLSSFNFHI